MKLTGMAQVLSHTDSCHANDALLHLNNLRREGILCDLTIKVEGREYKAHKTVMAACSDYFLNAICGGKTTATVTPGDHGSVTVDLEHVTLRGFAPLLEYAYTSTLQVNATDVIDVLSAASYMQMFKVANACSEFMRSNLLWSQSIPRLANFTGLHTGLLNSSKRAHNRPASPASSAQGGSDLPANMSTLLKATTAVGHTALGQPPLLIPMHSIAYDVGLQQLAATMAGTQNLLPASSSDHLIPVASSSSLGTIPPSSWPTSAYEMQTRKGSPSPKENAFSNGKHGHTSRIISGHSHGSNCRKSHAMKVETRTDDEDSRSSLNGVDGRGGRATPDSPIGSEPMEDSWQAIQKMYSIRMNESQSDGKKYARTYSPNTHDRDTSSKETHSTMDTEDLPTQMDLSNSNSNNNNNTPVVSTGETVFNNFVGDVTMKLNRQGIAKLHSDQAPTHSALPEKSGVATADAINGAMRSAFLQQQQLKAAQHNGVDSSKLVTLPAVPPNGQYMSVRRRTLQSTVPKPHQCQICGSRFTRFHNLKQHIKLHSGIKPYECDECGKRFTRNYTLRLHKMKHVGIRNFRCGTCDASFTSLGEFRAHLRLTMHSHMSGSSSIGPQSPPTCNSEPEDLSSPMSMIGANAHSKKHPGYDSSLLSFPRGLLGDRVSLLTAALGGAMMAREGSGSVGSSGGEASPQLSDRSISPQDLSTKGTSGKEPTYADRDSGAEDYPKRGTHDCTVQPMTSEEEYTHEESKMYFNNTTEKEQEERITTATGSAQASPSQECAESSTSERETGDPDDREPGSDGNIDRDSEQDENNDLEEHGEESKAGGKSADRPLSLVVNASA